MFFIGVFGIGNKNKNLGEVNFKCTGCIGEKFSLVELSRSFDIFFIPVFKYSKEYIIVCNKCRSVYKVKGEKIPKILNTKIVEYDDIEKIILETNTCPHCGTSIAGEYLYCPKCGKSLK
ncbi:zinc-ribbon domain-containing protein [uncultured Fusobacterium sp.]|uniref:zinc-ribbon domain-containing protein n=1 Tax=uncultured Fusobacterium sp. TaxID=159267 RepID=UPI0025F1A8EB|nr:zinc-ribbon domain-containing protein [uncultured Fusobacterium sp.]